MEKFVKAFEEYCSVPGVKSNKSASYAKGIQYLCEYLDISIINEDSLRKIDEIKEYVADRNSVFYNQLLFFLTSRNQKSYLEGGFIQAALKEFFSYVNEMQSSKKNELFGTKLNYERCEKQLSTKEILQHINTYITAKGFTFDEGLIENYYLSLKSKPFVILAGTSGTGKTRLVRLFAEAIGATAENGRYKLVSVRPDWSDSSDLFGHANLQGEFVQGAIIDFVKEASKHTDKPYFLCLDEMNLARVEYYLSDFLSIIETRKKNKEIGKIVTDEIELDKAAQSEYGGLYLPENLYVIGTVNMDETTFPFSKKVLDRANTIEFSYVDLNPDFSLEAEETEGIELGNDFLKAEYIVLKADVDAADYDYISKVCTELQDINRILQEANAHVGYRVRDEIVFYMLNSEKAKMLSYEEALDNEIMQKILPRIQGSGAAIKELLCELFKKFAGDYSGISQDSAWKQMKTYIETNEKNCKYKKSAEKICYMMRRFEEDGFTSYWL